MVRQTAPPMSDREFLEELAGTITRLSSALQHLETALEQQCEEDPPEHVTDEQLAKFEAYLDRKTDAELVAELLGLLKLVQHERGCPLVDLTMRATVVTLNRLAPDVLDDGFGVYFEHVADDDDDAEEA